MVIVEQFKERDNGVTYIGATIYVERENHKGIIIGRKGEQLRKIGAAARQEIQRLIESKVYLELWVKVEPNWRYSDQALKQFGFGR
jgi:GTP-binding protein Era